MTVVCTAEPKAVISCCICLMRQLWSLVALLFVSSCSQICPFPFWRKGQICEQFSIVFILPLWSTCQISNLLSLYDYKVQFCISCSLRCFNRFVLLCVVHLQDLVVFWVCCGALFLGIIVLPPCSFTVSCAEVWAKSAFLNKESVQREVKATLSQKATLSCEVVDNKTEVK